jgi:hypothetical protein
MTLPEGFDVADHIGGEPITVDDVVVGRILEKHLDGTVTVWIDPKKAPVHGYSPELNARIDFV